MCQEPRGKKHEFVGADKVYPLSPADAGDRDLLFHPQQHLRGEGLFSRRTENGRVGVRPVGGQTHEYPGAHVGGTRAERGHQSVHFSAAEEVLFLALALFRLDKEENAYSYDKHKIQSDRTKFDGIQT